MERVLLEIDGIQQVAVVGLPSDEWGEVVVAVVIGEVEWSALQEVSQAKLAPYKRPRHLVVVDDFPRNAMGKVQKAVIRDFVQQNTSARERGLLEDKCGGYLWLVRRTVFMCFATEEHFATMKFFVDAVEDERLEVVQSDNPSRSARRYKGWAIALEESDEGVSDAYRLSEILQGRSEWLIEGDTLGLQYGLRMS